MPQCNNTRPDSAIKVMSRILYRRPSRKDVSTLFVKKIQQDYIAIEEPLQISLVFFDLQKQQYQSKVLTLTMRTPGNDNALVYGFLLCEGIIKQKEDIKGIEFNDDADPKGKGVNALCVVLAEHIQPEWKVIERQFTNHSSCGICGKTSLNALQLKQPQQNKEKTRHINVSEIFVLPDLLHKQQAIFSQTGGLHAAGLYHKQQLQYIAEDVGRHNAVDKVLGLRCLHKKNHQASILILSGRISFELVQKAIMANISIIVSVGAPSSLAISAAKQFDLTLIGFTKTDSFNVYHGDWRIEQ